MSTTSTPPCDSGKDGQKCDYPSGLFPGESSVWPSGTIEEQPVDPGDQPDWVNAAVQEMSRGWEPITICMGGTRILRERCRLLLPIEPRENDCSYLRRVSHATMAPFLPRIAEQAAGLITRKGVQLQPMEENGELDPYWMDFAQNVDGFGTDLSSYARNLALSAVLYGHAGLLCDYPSEAAANLAEERAMGHRPYFIEVNARQILGWRRTSASPLAPLDQVRIAETYTEPYGEFGDKIIKQVRVLYRGGYKLYRLGDGGWEVYEEGTTTPIKKIPLSVVYSGKISELISRPPLLPIAHLNINHAQRMCDMQHSLHVAAMPILTLRGFDDNDDTIGLSANSAILLPTDGKAEYVQPATSAFDAQQKYIHDLEKQMANLGISTLFAQRHAAETAESKRLSRTDSDSLLAVVSKDLEQCLQDAFDCAAAYIGMAPPKVTISRDFDLQTLDDKQISSYMGLWMQGAITQTTLLEMLRDGEVLPNTDPETEVEMTQQDAIDKTIATDVNTVALQQAKQDVSKDEEQDDGGLRKALEQRLAKAK